MRTVRSYTLELRAGVQELEISSRAKVLGVAPSKRFAQVLCAQWSGAAVQRKFALFVTGQEIPDAFVGWTYVGSFTTWSFFAGREWHLFTEVSM